MAYNHLKFLKKIIDRYINLYPNLDVDIICDIVEEVLLKHCEVYYDYDFIQEHPEFCKRCGMCCRTLDCRYFNGRTCDEHPTRYDACRIFPLFDVGDEIKLVLDPSCQYAIRCAEYILDKKIKEYGDI